MGSDGTTRLWNPTTAEQLRSLDTGIVVPVSFSPNGDFFASDSIDLGTSVILDSTTGQIVATLGNNFPTANAGPDQTVTDTDNSGTESVILDGSASTDSDGTITSYTWSEGGVEIATGATPTVDLAVGTHVITLTVTDNDGLTATDDVTITVQPGSGTSSAVTSFTLVNAVTDTDVTTVNNGDTVYLNDPVLNGADINLRANVSGTVESVVFVVDGVPNSLPEDDVPYAVGQDDNGDYSPWTVGLGTRTITAIPHFIDGAWHPSDDLVAVHDQQEIVVLNSNLQIVTRLAPQQQFGQVEIRISDLAWSPDGTKLAATINTVNASDGSVIGKLTVWERLTWQIIQEIPNISGRFVWSSDGNFVASSGSIININSSQLVADVQVGSSEAWNPGNINEYLVGRHDGVTVYNPFTGDVVQQLAGYDGFVPPVYNSTGEFLALVRYDGASQQRIPIIDIVETQGYQVINSLPHTGGLREFSLQWLGTDEIGTSSPTFGLIRWDVLTGERLLTIPVTRAFNAVWSPDGSYVVTSGSNYQNSYDGILTFNAFTGSMIAEVRRNPEDSIRTLALINSSTNERLSAIVHNAEIDLGTFSSSGYEIEAIPSPSIVGSVLFNVNGIITIDNSAPYTAPLPGIGAYFIEATPFNAADQTGIAGEAISISVNFVQNNVIPSANAGTDQTVTDTDNTGTESVILDGSASTDSDGTITSYSWSEGGVEIATGATPMVDLAVGTHIITLTATDNDGLTATDDVTITVQPGSGTSSAVTSFTLVNAVTDTDVTTVNNGDTVYLNDPVLNGADINLRANVSGTVESVVFVVDETPNALPENDVPYAVAGDTNATGNYRPWDIGPGTHTVTATPYDQDGGLGTAGTPLTITFTLAETADPTNQVPTAIVTTPELIALPNAGATAAIILDGSTSTDPDNNPNPLTYAWYNGTDTTATPIATTDTTTVTRGAGDYAFTLVVSDGSASDTVVHRLTVADPDFSVDSFTFINADTDQDVFQLTDGATVYLNDPPLSSAQFNVRANTSGNVDSVVFGLNGDPNYRTENVAPWTLGTEVAAGSGFDYRSWNIPTGTYTLTATPYSGNNGTGSPGTPLTITFTLADTDGGTNPNQAPTASATASPSSVTLQNVGDTATITLDGTASSDPDSGPSALTYAWYAGTDTTGTAIATSATTSVTLGAGTYTYTLVVDDSADTDQTTVSVTINNPVTGPTVTRLMLIDADADVALFELTDGMTIDLSDTPVNGALLNIEANVAGLVESVRFGLNSEPNSRTENVAPYTLYGDVSDATKPNGVDYDERVIQPGTYTITATAYTGNSAGGTAGPPYVITVTFVP